MAGDKDLTTSSLEDDTQFLWENVLNFKSNHSVVFWGCFFFLTGEATDE